MNKSIKNLEECHALVEKKFVLIPEFPRQDKAIESMVEILLDLCDTLDEAKWLVSEAARWDKWRGLGSLDELLNGRRQTAPERKVFHSAPPPAEMLCPICKGWGHYWDETSTKTAVCSCPEGSHPSAAGLVEAMNRKHVRGGIMQNCMDSPERRPITSTDLEFARRQNAIKRSLAEEPDHLEGN
jgi:hypothetical protein